MNRYDKGYISLYRKFKNWRFYKNDNIKSVFIHCLLSASWKDEIITEYDGKPIQPIKIKAGSFITSRPKMAKELGKTEGEIQQALRKLSGYKRCTNKSTRSYTNNDGEEISLLCTNKYTIVTVNNFNDFQEFLNSVAPTKTKHENNDIAPTVAPARVPHINNININKDKKDIKDIKDIKDRSTGVHSNFNSLTLKLLKNGFINDNDIPEVFDEMINEFLEEYSFNHVAVVLNYVLRKTKNKQINHKYTYLKKSLTDNLAKMQKMIDQENASEESQAPIKMNNEELNDLLDQLREGKL